MKRVPVDVYGQEILVFVGKKDIHKWIRKNPLEGSEDLDTQIEMSSGLAGVLFTEAGEGHFFIYIEERNLATLSHEALHIAYSLLDMIGVHHDVQNHEALAYLQEFIFKKSAEVLKMPTEFN